MLAIPVAKAAIAATTTLRNCKADLHFNDSLPWFRLAASALDKLGRKYDCCCHPEIMNAFVYGLNDTDERVRREAADEIGDQVRRNKCCCSPCVVSALTCALADCDRSVRREAEQALRNCGYEIVDGCCDGCCRRWLLLNRLWFKGACGATPTAAPAEAQQPTQLLKLLQLASSSS
jgi:hypothetical protein